MEKENEIQFVQLIETHKRAIQKICSVYCSHAEDRQDLAQDIVLQLWRSFQTYRPEFKFSTWLYRVALNVALSRYRKIGKKEENTVYGTDLHYIPNPVSSFEEKESQLQQLERFIQELKPLERALTLLYLEDKGYKEIGEILGLSESNVGTKLSRIKEKLKKKFSKLSE